MSENITKSLKFCWPDGADFNPETAPYALALLSKIERRPDPKFSGSPFYRRHWAEVETGKVLGRDTTSAESELEKEIYRLEVRVPQVLAELAAMDEEKRRRRMETDPVYLANQKTIADCEKRLAELQRKMAFNRLFAHTTKPAPENSAV